MADREYAPLSAVCVRTLSDKVYEKRKAAAFEIEKLTRECVQLNNHVQIQRVVKLLGTDFAASHNPNMRKGALVGLAAVAIALGTENMSQPGGDGSDGDGGYTADLIRPIITCMSDTDSRVRYYACESLYNVTKVAREHVLPLFNDVFSAMSVAITDVDQNVRVATELLVKLTMNIVTEQARFELDTFMPVLKERMYNQNEFARTFHLGWIATLRMVPESQLLPHLPDILDQLFMILSDKTPEIHSRCEKIMIEFLNEIKDHMEDENNSSHKGQEGVGGEGGHASGTPTGLTTGKQPEVIEFSRMVNILVIHAQSEHVTLQIMAAQWILEFVRLSGNKMYPHISGILMAQLPNLVFDDERRRTMTEIQYKRIRDLSSQVNVNLMKLVKKIEKQRSATNNISLSSPKKEPKIHQLELESLVEVLSQQLQRGRVETKLAALRWVYHLFKICQHRMVKLVDDIFPVLLKTLSDTSDEVVILNLQVLAEICSPDKNDEDSGGTSRPTSKASTPSGGMNRNPHFKQFLLNLLKLFGANRSLLETKGSFIIRQLCVLLSAEDIYRSLAELLRSEANLKFARLMVETLNTILLTTSELFELRNRLRSLSTCCTCNNSTPSSQSSSNNLSSTVAATTTRLKDCELFKCLYMTWCHSQIASVALCLLTGCYKHAADLVVIISEQEVTLEMLAELDRLVQLIESPIFTYLRMELLDVGTNGDLLRALQSLLMILPQSNAFRTLRDRLNCLHKKDRFESEESVKCRKISGGGEGGGKKGSLVSSTKRKTCNCASITADLDFGTLLAHFKMFQQNHFEVHRAQTQAVMLSKGVKLLDLSSDEEDGDNS